jgi:phage tail protein X
MTSYLTCDNDLLDDICWRTTAASPTPSSPSWPPIPVYPTGLLITLPDLTAPTARPGAPVGLAR